MSEYNEIMSRTMRQMLNNDEIVNEELTALVRESIRDDMGHSHMDADTYAEYHKNREGELAIHAKDTVRNYVLDRMEELPEGFARSLALDLIDYGNAYMWEDVARSYLPGVDDYREWVDAS